MSAPEAKAGIASRTLECAGWLFGRRLATNLIRLVAVAILARQLSPADFGLVALAQVLLQFLTLVAEAGVGTYVIYDAGEGRQERAQAAFWLNLAITVVQAGLCAVAVPLVGSAFSNPELPSVLLVLLLVFFVRQLTVVPEALVQRELRHRVLAQRDIVIELASAAVSVVLALSGMGVWSLVLPSLALEPVRLVISMGMARWRPRLPMHVSSWRPILRYTGPLMGSNVLGLVTNDGDTLLVGKLLGTVSLGFYSLAWQLSNLIGRNVTAVVWSVTMPALALLRGDERRLRAAYLRMLRFLGVVCLPLLCVMAALADDLVRSVYGPGWEPAVPLLRIFIAFTLVRSITSPSSMVYNVLGRPAIGFKLTVWLVPVYLLAIVVGSEWGAVGIATAVMITRTGAALVDLRLATGQIGVRLREVGSSLSRSALLSVSCGAVGWLVHQGLVQAGAGPLSRLIVAATAAGGFYIAGLIVLQPPGSDDLLRSVRSAVDGLGRRLRSAKCLPQPSPPAVIDAAVTVEPPNRPQAAGVNGATR